MVTAKKIIFSLLLAGGFHALTTAKAIIVDFDNTLVKVDRLKMARAIGLSDFLFYTILDFKNPFHLIDEVFHLLTHVTSHPSIHSLAATSDQKNLPPIFSHWLDGTWEYDHINQLVENLVTSFSSKNYFNNERHQRILKNSMQTMFNPEVLSKSIVPIKPALSLLKACLNKKDKNGNPEHEVFLLSNLATDTLHYFMKTSIGNEVLSCFKPENIIISGDVGMIKPNEDIYLYLMKKFNLNPKDCIFLDDQISNIDTAKQLGINGILVENTNYKHIRREFKKLQLI